MADVADIQIIKPGPADRPRVDRVAAKLSKQAPEKAEETRKKALASGKNDFVFLDDEHIFYPYFCMKMRDFRSDPTAADAMIKAGETANAAAKEAEQQEAAAPVATLAEDEERERRQQLLSAATEAGKQHREDKFPSVYCLKVEPGVVMTPLDSETMVLVAQWEARLGPELGPRMVDQLCHASSSTRAAFPFLQSSHSHHTTYQSLVRSYGRVLENARQMVNATEGQITPLEQRLSDLGSADYIRQMCEEKQRFLESEVARQKAFILTEPELMEQLTRRGAWKKFTSLHTFTLDDLGLVDSAQMPTMGETIGSLMGLGHTYVGAGAGGGGGGMIVEENYLPVGVQRPGAQGVRVVDGTSGEEVNISDVAANIKANTAIQQSSAQQEKEKDRQEKRKRDALECLADDQEQELNAKAMRK